MSAIVTQVRFMMASARPRRKPHIGDRRVTKSHGLQLRVVETHQGMWVRSGSGYRYDWRSPAQLLGTQWEHLVQAMLPRVDEFPRQQGCS